MKIVLLKTVIQLESLKGQLGWQSMLIGYLNQKVSEDEGIK